MNRNLVLIAFVIFILNSPKIIPQILPIGMEDIIENSKEIIKGTVINKSSSIEDQINIVTTIEVKIDDVVKGSSKKQVIITIPGGVVGDLGVFVSHTPNFYVGEKVLLFVSDDFKGRKTVTHGIQGKFSIINDRLFYNDSEFSQGDFISAIKTFVNGGERGKFEINSTINNSSSYSTSSVPVISSMSPSNLPALRPYAINLSNPFNPGERGSIINIYGANFGSTQGTGIVRFYEDGSTPSDAEDVLIWTDTHIQCKIPGRQWSNGFLNASSGLVYIIAPSGTSNGYQYDVPFATPNNELYPLN